MILTKVVTVYSPGIERQQDQQPDHDSAENKLLPILPGHTHTSLPNETLGTNGEHDGHRNKHQEIGVLRSIRQTERKELPQDQGTHNRAEQATHSAKDDDDQRIGQDRRIAAWAEL